MVAAVGFDVEEVVDDVGGGGAEAEGQEGDDGAEERAQGSGAVPGVGEQQGQEDEGVFGPLVEADGFEPGGEAEAAGRERCGRERMGGAEAGHEGGVGVGDHGLLHTVRMGRSGRALPM